MAVQLTDGSNNNVVDPVSKGILVQNPKTATQAGFVGFAAVRDSGSITGTPSVNVADITANRRLRVALDTPMFYDQFNYSAQNTANYKYANATMTIAWGSGYVNINSGNDVTSAHYAVLSTYRAFPLYTAGELLIDHKGYFTQTPQVNNTFYMGIGTPGTTAAPTDGVYFQLDSTGALRGVVNWNGTTSQSAAFTAPSANVAHAWQIFLDDTVAEFWIDGVLQASVIAPAGAETPSLGGAAVVFFQNTNTGTVSTAQQFHLENLQVSLMGLNTGRPWPHIKAGEGLQGYQGQNGGTMGSTALYANSAAPTPAVPTNTSAALGAGLGGNFYETATLAVGTDGIISSYQNLAGSDLITPRNLIITGIRWYSMVQTVLAGGPFVYECGVAFGHTSVSLATAEAATTKAPRRFPLGLYTLAATAAVGSAGASFVHNFQAPIVVQPGEFFQTIVRNIGTVGSSGVIAHHVGIEGYWE